MSPTWASPISSCCRSASIRSTSPGAISRSACSRRPAASASRPASPASSIAPIARGPRRHPRLGPGAFPDRRSTGSRRFDGTALYEHADPRKGFHPDWNTAIYNFGRTRGRQLPATPTRSTGSTASTSTACASMRSPRCSISTIRASAGEWLPNADGGNENREAIAFLRRANELVYGAHPGRDHHRRGIDRLARRVAADRRRRPRLRLQVEHGLDARHAGLHVARTRSIAAGTTTR